MSNEMKTSINRSEYKINVNLKRQMTYQLAQAEKIAHADWTTDYDFSFSRDHIILDAISTYEIIRALEVMREIGVDGNDIALERSDKIWIKKSIAFIKSSFEEGYEREVRNCERLIENKRDQLARLRRSATVRHRWLEDGNGVVTLKTYDVVDMESWNNEARRDNPWEQEFICTIDVRPQLVVEPSNDVEGGRVVTIYKVGGTWSSNKTETTFHDLEWAMRHARDESTKLVDIWIERCRGVEARLVAEFKEAGISITADETVTA